MPFIKNIKSRIDDAKVSKTIEEKQWNLNLQFLEGRQHISYDRNIQSYLAIKDTTDMPTINLLLPLYRNLVSRLASAYPGIVVMPASPSTDDIVKAQSSEAALRYFWSEEDIPSLINELVQWLIPCGNALIHTYYDPDKEKVVPEVIKPYDFYYERGVVEEKDARWIAIRRFYEKDDLIDIYPKHRKEIEDYADMLDEQGSSSPTSYIADTSLYYNSYIPPGKLEVFEVYDKKGNHGVILNDIWLYEGETPEKVYPCQHVKWTELRNRIWGLSLLTPLLEIQSYYNRARGQILENVELMSNPKWLIPKGSGVAPNAISKRAGEKIFYNPAGGTPQQISAAAIPSYVIDNIRQLQAELMDVSGIHSSTIGKRTTGILSGKAIQEMTSADLSSLQITQSAIEKACQDMATVVLVFMKAYYSEARMYKMLDTMGKIAFRSISNEDIVDVPEVFIQANTLFQSDAVERETRALQLYESGLITKEQAMEQISFRTSNNFVIEALQGIAHANEMLDAVKQGAAIEVFATDDLPAFQKVINEFIKSGEYYNLPVERQDYIRDLLVALSSYSQENADAVAAEMERKMKVFPRQAPNKETIATQTSPISQLQTAGQVLDNQAFQEQVAQVRRSETAMNEAVMGNGGAVR